MPKRNRLEHTERLAELVRQMSAGGVTNACAWGDWKRKPENEKLIAKALGYVRKEGMPAASTLLQLAFWPSEKRGIELPLVMFNYSKVAPGILFKYPEGWTPVLRQCRGIVFELGTGRLVALPMEKFFNLGEPNAKKFPRGKYVAPVKMDGHKISIFEYHGHYYTTTRGYFDSPTAILAQELLDKHMAAHGWAEQANPDLTLETEFIHPETEVLVDYHGRQELVLIAAHNRVTGEEIWYDDLTAIAEPLGLQVVDRGPDISLAKLRKLVKDPTYKNQEGFVVWFRNGTRIKLKFVDYLGRWFASKLTWTYVMNHLAEGDMEERVAMMAGADYQRATDMVNVLMTTATDHSRPLQDRWRDLYTIVPKDECTPYFQGVCRAFVKAMNAVE